MTTARKQKAAPDLGPEVDAYHALRAKLQTAEARLQPLRQTLADAEARLMANLLKHKLEAAKGRKGKGVTIVRTIVPNIEDQALFDKYVVKHKAFDLYQKRLSTTAWRERVDAGKVVPGVKAFTKVSMRVT